MSGETLIIGNGNFAAKTSKLLGYTIDSNNLYKPVEMDFSRSTTATYIGDNGIITTAAANIARVQNNALLLEPARTNLLTYSEDFGNVAWSKINLTASTDTQISPSGITNADTLSVGVDASSLRHRLYSSVPVTSGSTYTGTYYLKAAQHQWIQMVAVGQFATDVWANFNLSTGTIGSNGGAGTVASIESVGNGWYRCRITGVANATGSSGGFEIITTNNTNSARYPNYQSLVAEDVCYVWGAQFEAGAYPTSYIPTTTTSVTRSADNLSKTGASALIGQTEGSILYDFTPNALGAADLFSLNGGSVANNCILIINGSNQLLLRIVYNNLIVSVTGLTITAGTRYKIGVRYKSGDVAMYVNGVQYTSTNTYSFTGSLSSPSFTQGYFGGNQNQLCKSVAVYTTPLTNAELLAYSQS